MNYQKAVIAAGAGVAALFIVSGTTFAVFAATFDLASAFAFGGGSSEGGQVLWVVVPPAAVGFGSALLALALGAGWVRSLTCAGVGFVTAAYVSFREIVPYNPLLDYEARFIVFVLLSIAALSITIAIIRRADIPPPRRGIILALSAAAVVAGGTIIAFTTSVVASLIVALAVWILLPALAGVLQPCSGREVRS